MIDINLKKSKIDELSIMIILDELDSTERIQLNYDMIIPFSIILLFYDKNKLALAYLNLITQLYY